MKLLSKTSINYLWVSMLIMAVTGVLLFFFLLKTMTYEIREQLELQADMIAKELRKGKMVNFPLLQISGGKISDYTHTEFKDTVLYDPLQQLKEDYYVLRKTVEINGRPVRIKVMTIDIGWGGYQQAIGLIFIFMAAMFVLGGSLVNYFINRKIWTPFLLNMDQLKSYSVSSEMSLELVPSAVDEFRDLNLALTDLTIRARKEYRGLKEFTENASHEIQTPLAIIKSRLESISQLEINERIADYLLDAKQSVDRLSRLNRGLLLLAKLDNAAFPDQKQILIHELLGNLMEQMTDLFEHRGMVLQADLHYKKILASPYLVEIMLTNLLSNMRVHGIPGTTVYIRLDDRGMVFSNPGAPIPFPQEKLFSRFGRTTNEYEGNGLGLSIVRQICLTHHWEITYFYQEEQHHFEILFGG